MPGTTQARPGFACCGCGRIFQDEQQRGAHEETCGAVASCPGCDLRFSRQGFRAHLRARGCEAAECAACGVVFSCPEELADHCAEAHRGRGPPAAAAGQLLVRLGEEGHSSARGTPRSARVPVLKTSALMVAAAASFTCQAECQNRPSTSADHRQQRELGTNVLAKTMACSGEPTDQRGTLSRTGGMHQCAGCARTFSSRELLAQHLTTPPTRRRSCTARACVGCGQALASEERCLEHESGCERVVQCPGCRRPFVSKARLQAHVAASTDRECGACHCRGCGHLLDSEEARDRHERGCGAAWPCPGCRRCFTSRVALSAHLSRPPRMRPACVAVLCVGCGRAFSSEAERAAHEEACWRVVACPGCTQHFGSAADFQAHLQRREGDCSAAQCGSCGLVFSSSEECKGHTLRHRNSGQRPPRSTGQQASTPRGAPPGLPALQDAAWPPPAPPGGMQAASSSLAAPEEVLHDIRMEVGPLEGRQLRQRLRQLQLQWHPDRCWRYGVEAAVASRVFQVVQSIWEERILAGCDALAETSSQASR